MTNASRRQQAVSGAKLTFELLVRNLGHAAAHGRVREVTNGSFGAAKLVESLGT